MMVAFIFYKTCDKLILRFVFLVLKSPFYILVQVSVLIQLLYKHYLPSQCGTKISNEIVIVRRSDFFRLLQYFFTVVIMWEQNLLTKYF